MKKMVFLAVLVGLSAYATAQKQHDGHCLGTGHDQGLAADIGGLNGKPVSLYYSDPTVKKLVESTQYAFNHPKDGRPAPSENYGPAGLYRHGKQFHDKKLEQDHRDHIHIRY